MQNDLIFAVTGKTELGQKAIKKMIRDKGFHIGDHVTEKTNYLIANYPSETSKYRNALLYKTNIINEETFIKKIQEVTYEAE